jgi:hypothetical protein
MNECISDCAVDPIILSLCGEVGAKSLTVCTVKINKDRRWKYSFQLGTNLAEG